MTEVADLVEMRRALKALVDASPLSRTTIEEIAGFRRGYLSMVLGEPPSRGLSSEMIFSLLPILGKKLGVIDDPRASRRMRERQDYVICDERQRRFGAHHFRNAKALSMLEEMSKTNGKIGAIVRMQKMTKEQRSRVARIAAKSRWRQKRVAISSRLAVRPS